jgi:hypothetical protein
MRTPISLLALTVLFVSFTAEARPRRDKQGDVNVVLRGGVVNFTGELSDHFEAGPGWGVLVNVQPLNILGFEVGYDGSRNHISNERIAQSPALTRHGASGLIKLGPPLLRRIKPFVGFGIGVSSLQVSEGAEGLYKNDIVEELPLAAGLEFNSGAVTAGLRGGYRLLLDETVAQNAAAGNPQGGILEGSFTLGLRF